MSTAKRTPFLPAGVAPVLAAGIVAALAYALWPEPPAPAPAQAPVVAKPASDTAAVPDLPGAGAPVSEWIDAANGLMDHGHFARAAEGYTHVLHLDSNSVAVWVDRGACRHALGDMRGAESDFRRALALAPSHATAHFNLGIVFFSQGRIDSARTYFNYVIANAPGSNEAERARAILAGQKGS
jgi:Flp pilus assembly protein TadD